MQRELTILLVEDNDKDISSFKNCLDKCSRPTGLRVVKNGSEAMMYIEGVGRYRNREEFPLPSLVLLDLYLPGITGFELLSWIREQPSLAATPVIVLAASDAIRDVNPAYMLGANSFLVKPVEPDQLNYVLENFCYRKLSPARTPRPQPKLDRFILS